MVSVKGLTTRSRYAPAGRTVLNLKDEAFVSATLVRVCQVRPVSACSVTLPLVLGRTVPDTTSGAPVTTVAVARVALTTKIGFTTRTCAVALMPAVTLEEPARVTRRSQFVGVPGVLTLKV